MWDSSFTSTDVSTLGHTVQKGKTSRQVLKKKVFISQKDLQYLIYNQIWIIVNICTIAYIISSLQRASLWPDSLHNTYHAIATVLLQQPTFSQKSVM